MAFDKNLDKELFGETKEYEVTRIRVSVHSYNDGTPKLQLSRENRNADGEWTWSKLGRMTKDEVQDVIPIMQKAMDKL